VRVEVEVFGETMDKIKIFFWVCHRNDELSNGDRPV
jgi:hypothetical protein